MMLNQFVVYFFWHDCISVYYDFGSLYLCKQVTNLNDDNDIFYYKL